MDIYCGILILENNKTYGKKHNKFLYKCIPDDKKLNHCLIPYEIKYIGFSKIFNNIYILFSYTDNQNEGILKNVIGDTNKLENFYEYQIYRKKLNISYNPFTKIVSNISEHDINVKIKEKIPDIENRLDFVFTIDPIDCKDFDDAFSIKNNCISIYISNVAILLETFNLWEYVSKRVSTIYLPNKKISMLPTKLSDNICSLTENTKKVVFYMDIFIENNEINKIKYGNCFVTISKNFRYEASDLLKNKNYINLFNIVKNLNYKYCTIFDSHDIVSYLMILMNYYSAVEMSKYKTGIFRTILKKEITENIPEELKTSINIWNCNSAKYILFQEEMKHELLKLQVYLHITSPIRRLVDILNMINFQCMIGLFNFSKEAKQFYDKWKKDIEYINTNMNLIKKVQRECEILEKYMNNPLILNNIYEGYLYDKIIYNNSDIIKYKYNVFLPELKLYTQITLNEDINENFLKRDFKLILFNNKENFKTKIKLSMI